MNEVGSMGKKYAVAACEGVRFGLPAELVDRVDNVPTITPLPQAPAWLRGLALHEGMLIPVYDVAALVDAALLLEDASAVANESCACIEQGNAAVGVEEGAATRQVYVLVELSGAHAGFVFEEACGMREASLEELRPVMATADGIVRFSSIIPGDDPVFVVDVPLTFDILKGIE